MAKDKDTPKGDAGDGNGVDWDEISKNLSAAAFEKFPAALRDAGAKAAELAQNPVARSMLAAGLVTAAAALSSSQKVRSSVKDAGRGAIDNAEAAADSASKIGASIINAATDAVRRLMGEEDKPAAKPKSGAAKSGNGAAKAKPKARTAKAKSDTPAKAKSAKAQPKSQSASTKAQAKPAAKPRAAKSAGTAPKRKAASKAPVSPSAGESAES